MPSFKNSLMPSHTPLDNTGWVSLARITKISIALKIGIYVSRILLHFAIS